MRDLLTAALDSYAKLDKRPTKAEARRLRSYLNEIKKQVTEEKRRLMDKIG